MNRFILTFTTLAALLAYSCSPQINKSIIKQYDPIHYARKITHFQVQEPAPEEAELIGHIEINGNSYTDICSYEDIVEHAQLEARKMGGDAIKIITHLKPNYFTRSCHYINAMVLRSDSPTQ